MSAFPRTLVLTKYPFDLETGPGIALTNYFDGWPADRLAQAYLGGPHATPESSLCTCFYRLARPEIRRPWPVSLYDAVRSWRRSGPASGSAADVATKRPLPLVNRIKFGLAARLRDSGRLLPVDGRISEGLAAFIRDFAPEIVFTTLGDLAIIRLTARISEAFNLPIAVQICDDWMSHQYLNGAYGARMRAVLDAELRALFEYAALRFSICRTMSEAYRERYGLDFLPLLSPVEFTRWNGCARAPRAGEPEKLVVYAGTVMPFAQLDALLDVRAAIERLNRAGTPARLSIYTPSFMVDFHGAKFAGLHSEMIAYRGRDDLIDKIAEADLLVLPVNFDANSLRFIRYSMPAKIAAYMASGIPILAYGPPQVPPVAEAAREGFAYTVTEPDVERLAEGLEKALTDAALRRRLAERAVALARERHDMAGVCAFFREQLAAACRAGRRPARASG